LLQLHKRLVPLWGGTASIRVLFTREPVIGAADFVGGSIVLYAQHIVRHIDRPRFGRAHASMA
jgi:hypothetical protein